MDKVTFRAGRFSPESLLETEEAWKQISGDEVFTTELKPVFEWASQHIDYGSNEHIESKAYGLFGSDDGPAEALIEVVSRRIGVQPGITKLLKIIVSPDYWNDGKKRGEIVRVFLSAITGTIKISEDVRGGVIKLYGRSNALLDLLTLVCSALSKDEEKTGIQCRMHGRWLEIRV